MKARDDSEDVLIAAARTGDGPAIERLLERYQDRIFGFGLRMCGDTEDAKDVLQDTLLAAARSIARFRGDASVSTWLYTIAKRFCIKQRRRSRFAPTNELPLDEAASLVPSPGPQPDEQAARVEIRRALARALAALDPATKDVLILRDIEGLTAAEVAKVTGSSVPAVKSRLHRGRTALGARLAAELGESPVTRTRGCPDVLVALSKQAEGDIDPRLCARIEHHIEGCAVCRDLCDSLKRSLAACHGMTTTVPDRVKAEVREALRTALASRPLRGV